jgi:tripartite-type tricarboxylate transporter receptor subunit TctC
MMTGVNMVHVPYRGMSQAFADLIGAQVQVIPSVPLASSIEFIRSGKLRALAMTSATRSEVLRNLPTMNEFVPGYEASQWFGVGAPKNTSVEIVEKLNREINTGLADPKMKAKFADLGSEPLAGSAADFGRLITAETDKWAKVVRAANIKPQ